MTKWYTRPVVFVTDISRSLDFYVAKLGFHERWRHEENGLPLVMQVDRQGCELILTRQWPEKAGTTLLFVSLDAADLGALKDELARNGVEAKDGYWGYRLIVVADPDGNQLYFPLPDEK